MRALFLLGFYGSWLFAAGCTYKAKHHEPLDTAKASQRFTGYAGHVEKAQTKFRAAAVDAKAGQQKILSAEQHVKDEQAKIITAKSAVAELKAVAPAPLLPLVVNVEAGIADASTLTDETVADLEAAKELSITSIQKSDDGEKESAAAEPEKRGYEDEFAALKLTDAGRTTTLNQLEKRVEELDAENFSLKWHKWFAWITGILFLIAVVTFTVLVKLGKIAVPIAARAIIP